MYSVRWIVAALALPCLAQDAATLSTKLHALQYSVKQKDLLPDVAIYEKAARMMQAFPEEMYSTEYKTYTVNAIAKGLARAAELERGSASWTTQTGRVMRGYKSRIDDSVQPYRLNIPASYDGTKPVRLDVILHGRNAKLTEASFLAGDSGTKPLPPEQNWIELEVYGRGNNAYRWAGETDVMEALASVVRRYKIDPERILLRGFSMGGAGVWHIGLHYPSQWAGMEAGAGFTETMLYAKRANVPAYERAAMHIYDAVDYALNALNLPVVGYGGEIDPQLAASQNVEKQLHAEGVDFSKHRLLFLIGPNTQHKFHPESKKQSEAFLLKNLPRTQPSQYRFVTYTPRYSRIWNVDVNALTSQYERAELTADGTRYRTGNIAELRFAKAGTVTIDGKKLRGSVFHKEAGGWKSGEAAGLVKRHGLQGPIDDAFMDRFVCSGSGDALETFSANFHKFMRGEVRLMEADKVTVDELRESNLILFGEPWSNPLMARILPRLPVQWTRESIVIKGQTFDAATHTLALIYPNPLAPERYVVFNSGHTFGKSDFEGTNALLYPRLGDYAVIETRTGAVKSSGFFDSHWR